jgi:hypothetical protein
MALAIVYAFFLHGGFIICITVGEGVTAYARTMAADAAPTAPGEWIGRKRPPEPDLLLAGVVVVVGFLAVELGHWIFGTLQTLQPCTTLPSTYIRPVMLTFARAIRGGVALSQSSIPVRHVGFGLFSAGVVAVVGFLAVELGHWIFGALQTLQPCTTLPSTYSRPVMLTFARAIRGGVALSQSSIPGRRGGFCLFSARFVAAVGFLAS